MKKPLPIRAVPETEIRQIFNDRQYYHRISSGEIWQEVLASPHATPSRSGEPFCTHSQLVAYREKRSNRKVALVHQYLRSDGTLGASGKPDPKWLLGEGEILVPDKFSKKQERT
jgi:hypothetical protein